MEAQLRELVEIMDERIMASTVDGYEDRRDLLIANELKFRLEDLEEAGGGGAVNDAVVE